MTLIYQRITIEASHKKKKFLNVRIANNSGILTPTVRRIRNV